MSRADSGWKLAEMTTSQRKFQSSDSPLDLVQSLHSTAFYRNSKGTKERNTRGLVAEGRAGVPDCLSVTGFRKDTHSYTNVQSRRSMSQPVHSHTASVPLFLHDLLISKNISQELERKET